MGLRKSWTNGQYDKANIVFDLQGWEEQLLSRRIRTRVDVECWGCGQTIPKSSFAYGKKYSRVCIKCWENVIAKAMRKGMKNIEEMICDTEKDIEKNRKKIEQVNMLANLQ